MAGDINASERAAFKDMLVVCQTRGRDSTGAIRVDGGDKYHYAKRPGIPEYLIDTKEYDRVIDTFAKVLVGHCRAKTIGAATIENAHPFAHGALCGVHNGTIRSHRGMERANDFGTDSEWLYWHASEYGMEATIAEIDENDAWSLVWWDAEKKELNFLRNKNRPLWFTHSENMKVMLWASEPWMFGAFHRRHKLWDGGENKEVYYQLAENTLHSFQVASYGKTGADVFKLTKIKEVKGKEFKSSGVRWQAGNPHGVHGASGTNGGQVPRPFSNGPVLEDNRTDKGSVLQLPGPINSRQESQTTPKQGDQSSTTSQIPSDSTKDSNNSKNGRKPTLSLVSPNSGGLPQDNKRNSSADFKKRFESSCETLIRSQYLPKPKQTSLRIIAKGMKFITDLKTSREWGEEDFDDQTGGICCFCKSPIGDLKEVNEIFIRTTKFARGEQEELVTFLCDDCVDPTLG